MIELRALTKIYQETLILNQLDLSIPDLGIIAIMGQSGVGKTTLLRIIAGLEMADSGQIEIDGVLASDQKHWLSPNQRNIGYVFQQPALWPHMTIAENIDFGLHHLTLANRQDRVNDLLEQIDLVKYSQVYPHQLSGGQAKRVALARSLAPQPKYLFFDEPLTNLDDGGRLEMLSLIRTAAATKRHSIVYVTHRYDEVVALGGKCFRLIKGRLDEY